MGGLPKISGTPIFRNVAFWGPYGVPLPHVSVTAVHWSSRVHKGTVNSLTLSCLLLGLAKQSIHFPDAHVDEDASAGHFGNTLWDLWLAALMSEASA